jgi:uncharacterized protein YecT (DUF1311 family)
MKAKDGLCQSSLTTSQMTNCFATALKKADSELNGYYQRIQTVVDGDGLAELKTAQRLWIQFRDANCDAEYELYSGGTAASMVKLACLEATTSIAPKNRMPCMARLWKRISSLRADRLFRR